MYNSKMKMSEEMYSSIFEDCRVILRAMGWNGKIFAHLDHGRSGVSVMWVLLNIISCNRAYDDSHPYFAAGRNRLLPYDGREFTFYYADGCNDSHISTALAAMKLDLIFDSNE